MTTLPLLLEIGAEELPSSFVDGALAALPKLVTDKLAALRLAHGEIRALGTPRRLAVIISDLAQRQADLDEEVLGPPETAAFKDGKPTKAAEAFAAKLGVSLDQLTVIDGDTMTNKKPNQKPGRYLVGRRAEKGGDARELLGRALAEVCAAIPFRKSMRWGKGDGAAFGRPVQWLVALFGKDAIDVNFAGIPSGRASRGHRFLAPAQFEIESALTYVEQLRKAHVLVDRKEREETMMARVNDAAKKIGGSFVMDQYLVDENASLVEEPHVVTGSFDQKYLELPREVIIAVARGHQKYFSVEDSKKDLLPNYLAIVNTANNPANIIKGNDRVMTARLSDARFFFEEDKKHGFSRWNEKIGTIVFHARLGSVKEKVARIEKLASIITQLAFGGGDEGHRIGPKAERAAQLCKSDLASLMVGEFPELQGTMGQAYALAAGEDPVVASAVRDHYKPVGADDDLPKDDVAAIVALADRIDTLTGCFAVGLAPTGSADPYALRRNCIAALRLLSEHQRFESLKFSELIRAAYTQFEWKKPGDLDENATVAKISEFATERLRGLIANQTSNAVAEAVIAGRDVALDKPAFALMKAKSLQKVMGEPWIETARAVGKRLRGISKDSKAVEHEFAKDDAKNSRIVRLVLTLDESTRDLARTGVEHALEEFETVAKELGVIFDETLINDPNDPLTQKRLELLSYGASCMLRIADFSRLS
ncbi:MAG: glycine--tRNA ligase subunit beta [Polyangiaceae bacterium]